MSNYKKVALIVCDNFSSWKSCQHITINLLSAYSMAFKNTECKTFFLSSSFNRYEAGKLAKKISTWEADLIVWLDHSPNPTLLINQLCHEYYGVEFNNRPGLRVHIFGDFVLDCLAWQNTFATLKEWPIHFVAASDKQQKLIKSFFYSSSAIFSTLPFPVDTSVFNNENYLEHCREVRNGLGIEAEEKVLIYTGRISYQKNIDTLIKIFELARLLSSEKVKLLLVGPWDDILIPYFGKLGVCGSFFNYYSKTISTQQEQDVIFINTLDTLDLVKFYHASDAFISLSTYNDEDFGMSPAEALCCGLPCLLSDWAGYSSFVHYAEKAELISVGHTTNRPNVHVGEAREKMSRLIKGPPLHLQTRKIISEEAHAHLSIESLSKKYIEQLDMNEFGSVEKFNLVFESLCKRFQENPKSPFTDPLYREVYGVY